MTIKKNIFKIMMSENLFEKSILIILFIIILFIAFFSNPTTEITDLGYKYNDEEPTIDFFNLSII